MRLVVFVERSCRPDISFKGVSATGSIQCNAGGMDARADRGVFSDAVLVFLKTAGVNTVNHAFRKYRIDLIPAAIRLS
jgi:hypothetical protein